MSILLYGCTTKRLEKNLDGNYTRMLRAILNKSWQQHPTRHQLYVYLIPITKTIHIRRTRHAWRCWRSKDELISDVLLWTPHMAKQKQDDQLEHIYSSYVRIRDVALKTCQKRWMIGRSGESGSGISVLVARHDHIYIYIYIERERERKRDRETFQYIYLYIKTDLMALFDDLSSVSIRQNGKYTSFSVACRKKGKVNLVCYQFPERQSRLYYVVIYLGINLMTV